MGAFNLPPGCSLGDPDAPWNEPEGCYREGCEENVPDGETYCSVACREMAETGHDVDAMREDRCVCVRCAPTGETARAYRAKQVAAFVARTRAMVDAVAARRLAR